MIKIGFFGTTSTGAVLVILIGIIETSIIIIITIHALDPTKYFFKKFLIEKSVRNELKACP